jgi:hypothetical protein
MEMCISIKISRTSFELKVNRSILLTSSRNMDETVTIVVDESNPRDSSVKTKFIVHKSFACHYSPVFKLAFDNEIMERQTRRYRLANTSANTAQLLVQWIYTQNVGVRKITEKPAGERKSQSLVQLWILAEKLEIPRLQNAVVREFQALRDRGEPVPTLSLKYVYEHFPRTNPLRRLLVHQCAGGLTSWFTEHPEQFTKEMLLEVTVYLSKAIQSGISAKDLRENTNLSDYFVPEA